MNLLRVTGKPDVVALTPDVSIVSILALVLGVPYLALGCFWEAPRHRMM